MALSSAAIGPVGGGHGVMHMQNGTELELYAYVSRRPLVGFGQGGDTSTLNA